MRKLFCIICILFGMSAYGADILLTPDSSLADAVRKAREMRRLGKTERVTIQLQRGTYRLYEPLRLRPEDEGLTIVGDGAVISGGMTVSGWRKQGRLWVADVPDFNGRPVDFRQVWVNGKKAVRARDVSDFEKMSRIMTYDKKNRVLWVPTKSLPERWREDQKPPSPLKGVSKVKGQRSKAPQPPKGGVKGRRPEGNCQLSNRAALAERSGARIVNYQFAELVLHEMWCVSNLRIKDIRVDGDSAAVTFHDPEAKIQFEHPWPSPMTPDTKHPSPFYLTNAKDLLDEPGEWYHDIRTHQLYYLPRTGEDMTTAEVVVPVLETLVEIIGTAERPVRNISFKGISFQHTTWMRPSEKGHVPLQAGMYLTEAYKLRPQIDRENNHKLDNQGWLGRADAAVEVTYGDGIDFNTCRFTHLGGSGLDYVWGCHGGSATDCTFEDIAMNGYVSGSFSPAGLETHLPYQPTDGREVCRGQEVKQCLFHNVTNEDWGCVAIAAGYVAEMNIEHNTIHDVSYTGISVGWGWNRDLVCMKDNRIHANLIYDYAKHMYDCAGIYTLGNQPGTMITENVVRDIAKPSYVHDPNHWFYLYTDEGSSNITLKENWTPEEKFLKNAVGPNNVWENNGPMVSEEIKARAGKNSELTIDN